MGLQAERPSRFEPTQPSVSQVLLSHFACAVDVLPQGEGVPKKNNIVPSILPESLANMSTQRPAEWVLGRTFMNGRSTTSILDRKCSIQSTTLHAHNHCQYDDKDTPARSSVIQSILNKGTAQKAIAVTAVSVSMSKANHWRRTINPELTMDTFMAGIVLLNTLSLGLSSDIAKGSLLWVILDIFFVFCFFVEIVFKMKLGGIKGFFCGRMRAWNTFDFIVFVLAGLEVAVSIISLSSGSPLQKSSWSVVRIVRMCRITRLARLIRFSLFKDLLMMINGMMGGMRTLFWSMVLILLPLYAVAVLLRDSIGGNQNFDSLDNAMFTVFRCFVSGDCSDPDGRPIVVSMIKQHGTIYGVGYCTISLLMTFGLFNVIIALYVESTVAAAKHNDVLQRRLRLQDQSRLTTKARELIRLFLPRTHEGTTHKCQTRRSGPRGTRQHYDHSGHVRGHHP